jgi:hypothetical protein
MSHYCDETYDVYHEQQVVARKPHDCSACKETIPARTSYWRVTWVYDGSADGVKRCNRCQAVHRHLRKKCAQGDGDMWPDERLNCGLKYEDEWGALPAEIEALAFALPTDPIPMEPA